MCPNKKKGDKVATAVHDFTEYQTYIEKTGHNFTLTATFDEINPEDYEGLWIPGGRAPEYLRLNHRLIEIVRHFIETNKPLATLCHGPQILVAAGGIQGRKLTCYSACSIELRLAGAEYVEAPVEDAVVDGNIITGVAWPSNPFVLKRFSELLNVTITHNQ